jgi:hypothetical protein
MILDPDLLIGTFPMASVIPPPHTPNLTQGQLLILDPTAVPKTIATSQRTLVLWDHLVESAVRILQLPEINLNLVIGFNPLRQRRYYPIF